MKLAYKAKNSTEELGEGSPVRKPAFIYGRLICMKIHALRTRLFSALFCVVCFLLRKTAAAAVGKGTRQKLGQFVVNPCTHYGKLHGKEGGITSHLQTSCHKQAQAGATVRNSHAKSPHGA